MICVQFEIVCTLQIDFFLFCPQGKKRNIQLLGLLRTTSEIIENIFMSVFPSSCKMSISLLRSRDIIEFVGKYMLRICIEGKNFCSLKIVSEILQPHRYSFLGGVCLSLSSYSLSLFQCQRK